MLEKLKRLYEIKTAIDELEKEKDLLQESVLEEIWDDVVVDNWVKYSKTVRRTPKLRSWVSDSDVRLEFPDCVVFKTDVKALAEIPEAHKFLTLSTSEFISIKVTNGKDDTAGTI